MEAWHDFFLGELGAAAAFAGLLFVSISVNQQRILAFPGLPERAVQALVALFLVMVVSSIMLVPGQTVWLTGLEVLVVAVGEAFGLFLLLSAEMRRLDPAYRGKSMLMASIGEAASCLFGAGGILMMVSHSWYGALALALGALVSLAAAGVNAWVLLIEINR